MLVLICFIAFCFINDASAFRLKRAEGCMKNGKTYSLNEEFNISRLRYKCNSAGRVEILGCQTPDGKKLAIGENLVATSDLGQPGLSVQVGYRCYQENGWTKYQEFVCNVPGMPSCNFTDTPDKPIHFPMATSGSQPMRTGTMISTMVSHGSHGNSRTQTNRGSHNHPTGSGESHSSRGNGKTPTIGTQRWGSSVVWSGEQRTVGGGHQIGVGPGTFTIGGTMPGK